MGESAASVNPNAAGTKEGGAEGHHTAAETLLDGGDPLSEPYARAPRDRTEVKRRGQQRKELEKGGTDWQAVMENLRDARAELISGGAIPVNLVHHIGRTDLSVTVGRSAEVVTTKVIGFSRLVRGDFPFCSLFAIRVENEKVQKVVNNNYIATVQGEIRGYNRQALKVKQIVERLPIVPILTGNAWESITRGQAETLTKIQVLSVSGASFRVADILAIGSALAEEGLAIGRKEVSKFFEGVPEHAAGICRDWINQHQGQCAFSMAWDCYTALQKGLTYMVGKLSGLAIDGDRFAVVFLLQEIPRFTIMHYDHDS
jgi:hypothetical protein